ncbi:AbrB/MazE/SpoVT family DNA-binding domain-containing protein [Candidatus Woesearchaeota archaeon]|nr:AbrB/MazE/SpoVT family DNA-binding domain-containing protein [Candidatus Woesearchaeota archaeon]
METAKMSERGQIIIPKEVRDEVGASANTIFAVSALNKDTIVMKKIDTESYIRKFRELRSRAKRLSPAEIEAEIHEYRKSKSSA